MLPVVCDVDVSVSRFLPFSIRRSHILTIWWKSMFKVGRLQLVCGSEWEIKRTQWAGIIILNAAHIRTDHDMAGINDSEAGRWKEKLEDRQKRRPGVRGGGYKEWGKREGWGGKDELGKRERLSGSNVSEFSSNRISGSFFSFSFFGRLLNSVPFWSVRSSRCNLGKVWQDGMGEGLHDITAAWTPGLTFTLPPSCCHFPAFQTSARRAGHLCSWETGN